MFLRPHVGAGSISSVNHTSLLRQAARFTSSRSGAYHPQHVSRSNVVLASSRLVLTPTGSGSCDHIGEKVPMPQPFELKEGVYEVGRSSPADIVLRIPTVSTRHALLRVEDDKAYVTDLNSTNGTRVDGRELSPMDNVEITVGSEIVFGDVYLAKFQLDQMPVAEGAAKAVSALDAAAAAPEAPVTPESPEALAPPPLSITPSAAGMQ